MTLADNSEGWAVARKLVAALEHNEVKSLAKPLVIGPKQVARCMGDRVTKSGSLALTIKGLAWPSVEHQEAGQDPLSPALESHQHRRREDHQSR